MKLNKLVLKFVSISFSILVMLLVVIGLIKLGSFCYDFGYRVFTEGPVEEKPGTDVTVDVTGDLSEYQIGKLLKKEGLIRDANLFYVQLRMSAYHGKLKTGTYTLNTSMTAKDMMVVMAAESEESTESTESTEQIWIHRTEHLRMIPGRIMPEKKTRIQMRMNRQEQSSDSR